jgi:hypothetical protein
MSPRPFGLLPGLQKLFRERSSLLTFLDEVAYCVGYEHVGIIFIGIEVFDPLLYLLDYVCHRRLRRGSSMWRAPTSIGQVGRECQARGTARQRFLSAPPAARTALSESPSSHARKGDGAIALAEDRRTEGAKSTYRPSSDAAENPWKDAHV